MLSEERQKELLKIAQSNEADVKSLLKSFYSAPSQDCLDDLLKFIWSLELARKAMKDMSIDVAKLPLGFLKLDRIKKSLLLVQKI